MRQLDDFTQHQPPIESWRRIEIDFFDPAVVLPPDGSKVWFYSRAFEGERAAFGWSVGRWRKGHGFERYDQQRGLFFGVPVEVITCWCHAIIPQPTMFDPYSMVQHSAARPAGNGWQLAPEDPDA
jgi:hypothetical protein